MNYKSILSKLPYTKPFLFADEILHADEDGVVGTFTYHENMDFYKGHFKDNPVTPGVILTETMAQIGVVCLGIYLLDKEDKPAGVIALTAMENEFLKPVYPGEKVTVSSEKIYFRFGKLKCRVTMKNETGETVCKGIIAGILKTA